MKVRTTIKRRLSPVLLGATLSISFLSTACNSSSDAKADAEANTEANAIPRSNSKITLRYNWRSL